MLLIASPLSIHASPVQVLPIEEQPVLLRADQARWLGSDGVAQQTPPKLQPVPDPDGFPEPQALAPLRPEEGAVS
jgi:hypothetical protein